MKATELIRLSLENSKGWAMGLINDMKDSPLTQPTPNGGNHSTWVLGHIVRSESDLLDEMARLSKYIPIWSLYFEYLGIKNHVRLRELKFHFHYISYAIGRP